MTLSPTGARSDAGATAIWHSGGANGLHGHNTPNGDRVSCVRGADIIARCGAPVRGGLWDYGFIHIARMRSFQICLYMSFAPYIGIFGNRHNFAPCGA